MKKGKKILNPLIKMNNKKNFYLLSLKVANALKNKFYEEDTPYIFDELQSINEEMYQNFKEICSRQIEYEKELFNTFNEKNDEILRSLNSINVSKDSTIYLRCYSKEWTKPEPIPFIPTTHWEDKEELVVDSQTSVVLKNMVQKGNERMYKINLDINSKTSEYKKFEMICNSYDNNSNYSKGEIDIIKNKKMDIMENIIMATNIKLICEVQINEISKYLGNNGPKVERQHVFKPKKIINPTICDYCKEKLWGKAYTCQLCTFSCHIKCEIKVPLECNGVKTKRKSLRINCSQLSDGKHNISSPFIKTSKPFNGVNNITKIKEEDEENESGISDDERVKSELGETSEKALTKYTEKGEISKSALNKNLETPDDKITNPFSFNIKELLWYIDNNEFPSITADSLVDMPTISELIKKNSTIADDIEILQLRQQRHSLDSSSDSNELKNDNNNNKIRKSLTMNSIDNVIYNNISPSSSQYYNAHTGSSTVDSSDGFRNSLNGNNIGDNNIRNNEVDGNESISIIETNEISPSISNDIITEDENDITSNGISNDNSMENTSSDEIYEEVPMKEMNNLEIYKLNPDVRLNQISNNTSTYQFPKSKSLPMLYSSFDSDEEEEENEERKEKMAIERRNSYLREKFYLKNNINRPHDENFIKMIAMYDYQRQSDDELDLSSNEEVTLIIPDDGSGWAMVSSNKGCGLVPANYLMECAKVIKDYIPNENEPDKLQVKLGDVLLIIEKDNGSGYTRARIKDKEGLIPSTLIEPIS
jgi:nitrate reductase cytochrome c-type subunit